MRQKRSLWGLPFIAVALLAAGACSDQAEGQRCDTNNGDDDCASGLVCTKAAQLGGADTWALCCPPVGVPPTTAACQHKFSGFDAGPVRTPDGGSTPKSDASTPKPDAATPSKPDAATPSKPDAATPSKPDAAIVDAGKSG